MITFTSITKQADGSWQFSWVDTHPIYYRAILYGKQLGPTFTAPTFNISSAGGYQNFPPPLEVVEGAALALSEQYPPFLVMQWYAVFSCASYLVEQLISAAWTKMTSVLEGGQQQVYTQYTLRLADETSYSFRVSAVDSIGQKSIPRVFDVFIATPPTLVESKIRISYDQTNQNITVNAA